MRRLSKKTADPNQATALALKLVTEGPPEATVPKGSAVSQYLAEIGRKGGIKGGKARAAILSPKRRKDIARKAAESRWEKRRAEE